MEEYKLVEYFSRNKQHLQVTLRGTFFIISRGDVIILGLDDFNGNRKTTEIKYKTSFDNHIYLYSDPSGNIIVLTYENNIIFFNYTSKTYYIFENFFSNYKYRRIYVTFSPFDKIFIVCGDQYVVVSLSSNIKRTLYYNPGDPRVSYTWSVPTTSDGRYILRHCRQDIIGTAGEASYKKNDQYLHRINFKDKYPNSFSLDFYQGYHIYVNNETKLSPPHYRLLSKKHYEDADDIDLSPQLELYRNAVEYINDLKSCIREVVTLHNLYYFILTFVDFVGITHILVVDKRTNILRKEKSKLYYLLRSIRLFNRKILIQDEHYNLSQKLRTRIFDFTLKWSPLNHSKFIKELKNIYETIFICLWVNNIPNEIIYEIIIQSDE